MRKYIRVEGGVIELRTLHARFSNAEFEWRKEAAREKIALIDDEIGTLKYAEMPKNPHHLVVHAIDEFNMNIDFERDRLKEERKRLKADERLMSEV